MEGRQGQKQWGQLRLLLRCEMTERGARVEAVSGGWVPAKFWREYQQDLLVCMLGCDRSGSSMTKVNSCKERVARINWSDAWRSARCGEQNLGEWQRAPAILCRSSLLAPECSRTWALCPPTPCPRCPSHALFESSANFPFCSVSLEGDPKAMAWPVSCLKGSRESSISQDPGGKVSEELGWSLFPSPAHELGQ